MVVCLIGMASHSIGWRGILFHVAYHIVYCNSISNEQEFKRIEKYLIFVLWIRRKRMPMLWVDETHTCCIELEQTLRIDSYQGTQTPAWEAG